MDGEPTPITWSYSSLSMFLTCPKKYYHERVAKDLKQDQNKEYFIYGREVHKAAEKFFEEHEPLPEKFAYLQEAFEKLKALPGERFVEYKMGLTATFEPCGFFAKNVWWRGAPDFLTINGAEARLIDYKTGKPQYADTKQLEILSLAIFKHFPEVQTVKAGLLFTTHVDFVKAKYEKQNEPRMWVKWIQDTDRLRDAHRFEQWSPKPNCTCRAHGPVLSCHHNGRA